MSYILQYIKRYWHIIVVTIIGIPMFFVYAWFAQATSGSSFSAYISEALPDNSANYFVQEVVKLPGGLEKFNSPDETLNYFFTLRLAQDKPLYYQEPLEGLGNNLIRSRSVNVVGNQVVPGSFYGMYFIYGNLASIFGSSIITYLTPFFAVVGVIFFYLLITLIFNRHIALITSLLAYTFPGWVYFAARSMYHNVLFVSLLIVGLYLLAKLLLKPKDNVLKSQQKVDLSWIKKIKNYFLYSLAGSLVGLSLITRTSEIGWVAVLVVLIFIFNIKRINWFGLLFFITFLVITFIPVFALNYEIYNSPLSVSYRPDITGEVEQLIRRPGLLYELFISPFGFSIETISTNARYFLFDFFKHTSIFALVGFVLWIILSLFKSRNISGVLGIKNRPRQWAYFIFFLVISVLLLVYYGSWEISDRIDEGTVSMGTSFIRYWLPIYFGMLPFIGLLIYSFISLIRKWVWTRPVIVLLLLLLIAIPGMQLVFMDTDESLIQIRDNIRITQAKSLQIGKLVPKDAVVVLGFKQADKIFFPEHKRIINELVVPYDYESVAKVSKYTELLYYHFVEPDVASIISRRQFEPYDLKIVDGQRVYGREWLYKIVPISE